MHSRRARVVLAVSVGILLGYLALAWSPSGVPTDFSEHYVGGTLLREGHGADLYNAALQVAVRHRALPASSGGLPFVYSPPTAALAAPFTLLDSRDAFHAWSVAQLLLVIAAVAIAARAAPAPATTRQVQRVAAAAAACAGFGTAVLLALGQIDGGQALGIALAYSQWHRGHRGWGGFWLALTAATFKPQLALGLAALVIGWRDRRVLGGAVVGLVSAGAACLVISGAGGTAAFARAALSQFGAWHLATMPSLVGLAGSWLGDTVAAHAAGAAASAVALAIAFHLGRALRAGATRLEPAFVGAAVLSQLAAPHTYVYDLVLLAPIATVAMLTALRRDDEARWVASSSIAGVVGLWVAISLAASLDSRSGAAAPPGQLTAWVLIVAAAVAVRGAGLRRRQTPQHDAVAAYGCDPPVTRTPAGPLVEASPRPS